MIHFHIKIFVCSDEAQNILQAIFKHIVFWVSLSMLIVSQISALCYAGNILEIVEST